MFRRQTNEQADTRFFGSASDQKFKQTNKQTKKQRLVSFGLDVTKIQTDKQTNRQRLVSFGLDVTKIQTDKHMNKLAARRKVH